MTVNDYQENYTSGWIKILRSVRNHWIWKDPIKFQRWIDILLEVNHQTEKVNIGYELFDCKRGQSVKSLHNWGKQWNVSKDVARNFLKLLERQNDYA
jgi:coproporphyrinogen III oxidase